MAHRLSRSCNGTPLCKASWHTAYQEVVVAHSLSRSENGTPLIKKLSWHTDYQEVINIFFIFGFFQALAMFFSPLHVLTFCFGTVLEHPRPAAPKVRSQWIRGYISVMTTLKLFF
jgi:hypothetical protein